MLLTRSGLNCVLFIPFIVSGSPKESTNRVGFLPHAFCACAIIYIDLAKPKSGAPRLFILTGCTVSENKVFWNCRRFGVSGYSIEIFIA